MVTEHLEDYNSRTDPDTDEGVTERERRNAEAFKTTSPVTTVIQ